MLKLIRNRAFRHSSFFAFPTPLLSLHLRPYSTGGKKDEKKGPSNQMREQVFDPHAGHDALTEEIEMELGEDTPFFEEFKDRIDEKEWKRRAEERKKLQEKAGEINQRLVEAGVEPEGFVRVTKVTVKKGALGDMASIFRNSLVPSYSDSGFKSAFLLMNPDSNTAKFITMWINEQSMARSHQKKAYKDALEELAGHVEGQIEVETFNLYVSLEAKPKFK